jgi:hypothetical protein
VVNTPKCPGAPLAEQQITTKIGIYDSRGEVYKIKSILKRIHHVLFVNKLERLIAVSGFLALRETFNNIHELNRNNPLGHSGLSWVAL